MPDISFSDWVAGLAADTLTGPEKLPLLDGTTSRHVTAALLAAFAVDQLHQAAVITTINDADELNVFQSDIEKIITAQNFFNWVVDKLEALPTETTIVNGDKLVFNDGGVLKQIDIATVRTFLNSTDVALGAQIAALTAATLADSDQYVVAQGSTALKTTFAAIAARVHSQFLAYTASLPSVVTLDNSDTFYVNDGGVASKVTAATIGSYIQSGVGPAIAAAPWASYAALGGSANATDVFLLQRSATGRTATGSNLATYVVGTQNSAASSGAAVVGDSFLIFRSGTQYKMDVSALATHVIASGWSAASGSPVATGDKIVVGRGGTTFSVTVDQLKTFVQNNVQADVLNLTGLTSATLDATDTFLVNEGTTPRKATLAQLETQLWTDFQAYVAGLTSLNPLEDADAFYVIEGSTPRKITAANIASYIESKLWGKVDAVPAVQSGDDVWMRRDSVSYKLDVDALASYVSAVVAGDIDIASLTTAILSDADLFLVDDGGTNKKITLADLRSHFWSSFTTYVSGLTSAVTPVDADLLYMLNSGAPRKLTVGDLWDNRYLVDAKEIKLDDFAATDDNTDLNATTTSHGLLRKLSGVTTDFLRGDGAWATPVGSGSVSSSGSPTVGQSAEWLDSSTLIGVAVTGTGSYVKATTPTLVTPILGTPTSGVLSNCTGLPLSSGVTGNLSVSRLNGGTGASGSTFWRGDGTWAVPAGGVGVSGTPTVGQTAEWLNSSTLVGVAVTGSGSYVKATSPTLVTPLLGTPASGVLTNCTGLPLTTGVTGNLPVTNLGGGTGASSATFWRGDGTWVTPAGGGNVSNSGTPTAGQSAEWSNATTIIGVAVTGSGSYVKATSPTLVTPLLGTPTSGTLTNCTGLPLSTGVTGNLAVANLNSGTSASSSTFWRGDGIWATPAGGGNVSTSGTPTTGQTAEWASSTTVIGVAVTGTGSYVKSINPTLVTPILGIPASGTLTNCNGLPLSTGVTGNLPIANLNYGTNASSATFWRGDGIWATPAGGGNVSTSGTPTAGQAAEWTSSTAILGVDVTGSGNYVKATSPTLVTPLLGTPTSGLLSNCTGLPLTTGVTGTLPGANGGTGNAFFAVTGPTTTLKTYTFPNASSSVLTDNAAVTVAQGGTGRNTSTTAYGLIAAGTTATGAHQTLSAGGIFDILVGGGASALPVWTTAVGTGPPVRAVSPTLTTPFWSGLAQGASLQLTGMATLPSSTTSLAPLRIPHGVAPTSPTNGDVWTTSSGMFARVNGFTVGPFGGTSGANGHSGYASGTWYQLGRGELVAGSALVANSIRLIPFYLPDDITILNFGARIVTASSGNSIQLAIYGNAGCYPSGSPIAATASISTTTVGLVSATRSGGGAFAMSRGFYWMAINSNNSVAAMQTFKTGDPITSWFSGALNQSSVSPADDRGSYTLSYAQTFGTWPNLAGGALAVEETSSAGMLASCAIHVQTNGTKFL
jgi:hypothetical protein